MQKESKSGSTVVNILQKLYHHRLKITRKDGNTILNWSSLFSLACLIFAPHMSILGIVLSLILGYHITLEGEGEDREFEQRIRQAADTVKKTATEAVRTIKTEIDRSTGKADQAYAGETGAGQKARAEVPAEAAAPAEPAAEPSVKAPELTSGAGNVNRDVVEDLEKRAYDFQYNPAARSAFTAAGASVPTIQVMPEDESPAEAAGQPRRGAGA